MSVRLHLTSVAQVDANPLGVQISDDARSVAFELTSCPDNCDNDAVNVYGVSRGVVSTANPRVINHATSAIFVSAASSSDLSQTLLLQSNQEGTELSISFATGSPLVPLTFPYPGLGVGNVAGASGFLDDRWYAFSYTSTAPTASAPGTTTVQILSVSDTIDPTGPSGQIPGSVQQISLVHINDCKKRYHGRQLPSDVFVVATVATDYVDEGQGLTGPYSLNVYRFRNETMYLVDSYPLPQLPTTLDTLSSVHGRPALIAVGTRLATQPNSPSVIPNPSTSSPDAQYSAELQVFTFDGCKLRLVAGRKRNASITAVSIARSGQYIVAAEGATYGTPGSLILYRLSFPYLEILDSRAMAGPVVGLSWDLCQHYLAAVVANPNPETTNFNNLLIFQTA